MVDKIVSFLTSHFDTGITLFVTISGFVVTYLMTRKSFTDEVIKNKLALNAEVLQTLPYDICQMMNKMTTKGNKDPFTVENLTDILSRVLSYGSADAVKIAIKMQQTAYSNANEPNQQAKWELVSLYSLLITQIKYDLTSEIISPESWFEIKINDYSKLQPAIQRAINKIIEELKLNKNFKVKVVSEYDQ